MASPPYTRDANFTRFAWGVLAWNVLVVLWGAYVRASGSGAGCGSHWPLCNGEVVPIAPRIQTIIEFTHRMMSGVALLGVIALWLWSRAAFVRGSRVRRMALASLVFLIVEALLGAGLVLFNYVDKDQSVGRAFYLSLHLVNTLLLLAALVLTAWFSRYGNQKAEARSRLVAATLPIAIVVSVTGAIAALGDTLFPATSLAQGFHQDFSSAANLLLRLRVLHPMLATLAAFYFVAVAVIVLRSKQHPVAAKLGVAVLVLVLAQLCAGAINLILLAPVWMQITHLLLADLVWLSLVLLMVEAQPAKARKHPTTRSATAA
ncbi:MAG: COX15/CtaA family protein [Bryobacterales bacterium]|nr:COX15/CtaA family protein [Bryobacterales bacterium]